jgi:hypothetical protein
MMLGVKFARLRRVMGGMRVMAVCHMSVMAGLFDIVVAMVFGGMTMVLGSLLVVMSGLGVVFDHFVFRHRFASSLELGLYPGRCGKG